MALSRRRAAGALMAMVTPEAAVVQSLIDQHRSDAAEALSQRDTLDAKTQEIARLELELQQFVRGFPAGLPGAGSAGPARARRRMAGYQSGPTDIARPGFGL